MLVGDLLHARQHVAERRARREAERNRDRRQLTVMVHGLRPDDLRGVRERVERHDGAGRRVAGAAERAADRARRGAAAAQRPLRRGCGRPASRLRRRFEIEQRQRGRIVLELRRELEQHFVLVHRRVDRRHPARPVGVVERALDLVRRHAERRRLVAVDLDVDLRAGDLEIARQVLDARSRRPAPSSGCATSRTAPRGSGDCIEN